MAGVSKFVLAAAAASLIGSPVLAASTPVRPAALSQSVGTRLGAPVRVGRTVEEKQSLLGAPLLIAFLGAVAVTVGTIVIVNNNGSSSPN
jgi:hypothetical protein